MRKGMQVQGRGQTIFNTKKKYENAVVKLIMNELSPLDG
jgi:hypothetical protein